MLKRKYLLNLLIITEERVMGRHIPMIIRDRITGRSMKCAGKITNNRLRAKKPPAIAASLVSVFEILYRKGISDIR